MNEDNYLRNVFPLSTDADAIFRSIFTKREEECIDLLALRERLTNLKTFYMSEEELKKVINDQESGGKVYKAVIRCMRGSTAIVSLLNPEKSDVWVANLGDCQASEHLQLPTRTLYLI